jgi:PAS domain S-box-containing protein
VQSPALVLDRPRLAVTGIGIKGWRPFVAAAALAAVASLVFTSWIGWHWVSDQATTAVDDIGEAVAALVAAGSCGIAAARNTGRTRLAWTFFALSALSWGVGEIIWSVYEVALGIAVPFPSAADAGFLTAIPLAIAGLFAFTSAPRRLASRGEALLAGAIVALSLLFIAWASGLAAVYQTSGATPAAQLIGVAYPIGDIITGTILVLALRRARRAEIGRMLLLLGGIGCLALADSAFAYLTANGTYTSKGNVLDAGWVAGYLLVALAPVWPAYGTDQERAPEGPIGLWQLALPWITVAAGALIVLKMAIVGQKLDQFETVMAGAIGTLLVANQVLTHRDSLDMLHKSQRAESELERRNKTLDEVISHAPLGILRAATDMTVIDVNPRLAQQLGTTPEKMAGMPVSDYLHPDEFARVFQLFQPLWKGGVESVEGDSRALRADKTEVWLHWSATGVRNATGRIDYFLVMYQDTDAEHAANEAAAAHLSGLERLNKLKSEFVSLVSHEFRTALVGISGFSEMIRDEEITVDEAKGYAADINKESERLNRMINDMLDLDRIEAGRLTLHIQPTDVNALLDDAVNRARATTESHTIVADLDPAMPMVNCDPDRIAQVVANLLSNAVKYSPAGGEIAVTSSSRNGVFDVGVRDHGIGIAPDFVEKLFSRYERYEKTSGKILGTGLGLAIVRQIIELHGGKVWVHSEPGAGSDFHFTLPLPGARPGPGTP